MTRASSGRTAVTDPSGEDASDRDPSGSGASASDPPGSDPMTVQRAGRGRPGALVLVAALALAIGVAATLAVTRSDPPAPSVASRGETAPPREATLDADALAGAGFVELGPPPELVPQPPAADAAAAVEGFLAAEALDELTTSYEFLSPESQAEFGGSPAAWVAVHADVIPPVTGFVIGETQSGDDGTSTVTSTVGFEPSLDEVIGLVPAQAEVVWSVVRSDGRFGVDIDASVFAPRYVPDDAAADAVADWVAARQRCERAGEWGGTLLGVEGPVRGLCDAEGEFAVGDPQPLGELEATTFTAAFGEDALTWAREVPVTGPVQLRAVVAPVGTEWQVIGALPPAPG